MVNVAGTTRIDLKLERSSTFILREALASDTLPRDEFAQVLASERACKASPKRRLSNARASTREAWGSSSGGASSSQKRRSSAPSQLTPLEQPSSSGSRPRRASQPAASGDSRPGTVPALSSTADPSSPGKRHGDRLKWKREYSLALADLEVSKFKIANGTLSTSIELQVRLLCNSTHGVVRDDLDSSDRVNMRPVVVMIGDVGRSNDAWVALAQPGVHMYLHGFNVIWFDIPAWSKDVQRWMKHGAELLLGYLKYVKVENVRTITRGIGGAIFVKALTWAPSIFGKQHLIYNMDFPEDGGSRFPGRSLCEILEQQNMQMWFAYCDDQVCDRSEPGSAQEVHERLLAIQTSLFSGRTAGKTVTFDEIIFSENLNLDDLYNIDEVYLEGAQMLLMSKKFLKSLSHFLTSSPTAKQEGVEDGLLVDAGHQAMSPKARSSTASEHNDDSLLTSMRRLHKHNKARRHSLGDPYTATFANRRKMSAIDFAMNHVDDLVDSRKGPKPRPLTNVNSATELTARQAFAFHVLENRPLSSSSSSRGNTAMLSPLAAGNKSSSSAFSIKVTPPIC